MRSLPVRPIGALAVVLGIALSACSSDTATTPTSVVGASTTAFNTVAPPTTPAPTTTVAPLVPGSIIETESTYTIVSGDYPSTVASRFAVSLDDLISINDWTLDNGQVPDWPLPGTVIKIPAGAKVPGEPPPTTTIEGQAPTATTGIPVTTLPACTGGTYVIQDGDAPSLVATKFDTTIAELDAANVDTPGYSAFIVGATIKIPDKTTDC